VLDRMRRRRGWVIGGGLVAVALVGFVLVWFQPQKLFLDRHVDEALPTTSTAVTTTPAPTTTSPIESSTSTTSVPAETTTTTAPAGPVAVAMGEFIGVAHAGTGTVLLIELEDGSHVLRFEGLDVLDGPDLRVILSDRPITGADDYADGDYVDLGALKGNVGNQNYEIPAGLDLSRYPTAAIWCRRFDTTFNAAPLEQA
jgi:hypothetical protein